MRIKNNLKRPIKLLFWDDEDKEKVRGSIEIRQGEEIDETPSDNFSINEAGLTSGVFKAQKEKPIAAIPA